MTHGQSDYTKFKISRFRPVLAQSLRISKASNVAQYTYWHGDLNCAGGFNEQVGVEGSPLNFLSAVEQQDRSNFRAFFIDEDTTAIKSLIQRPEVLRHVSKVAIFRGDNSELLSVLSESIRQRERNPQFAIGSLVIDPNGYHNGVPWESLRWFCAEHPRIDLFFNLNARSFRLERPHIEAAKQQGLANKWASYTLRPVSTFPALFSRPNWMITRPVQIAGSSWVQLVGRTIATSSPDYRSLGYYALDSAVGEECQAEIEGGHLVHPQLFMLEAEDAS